MKGIHNISKIALSMTWTLLVAFLDCLSGNSSADKPLTIRGDNTVIVDCGDSYSTAYLQHFLLKYVSKQADAEKYAIDYKPRPDRSASPNFPVIRLGKDKKTPAGKVAIVVGPVDRVPESFIPEQIRQRIAGMKRGTVVVRREGNIIIAAKKTRDPWNLNPVRIFLDKAAGVRMYAPSGANGLAWVSMPEEDEFVINDLDILMEPFFAKTTFSSGGFKRNVHWLRMNCMVSEGLDLRASHTIINYFNPKKYYDKYPQLFPMSSDGSRPEPMGTAWNPCLADPELAARVAMEEVRKRMSARRKPGYLSFGVMDAAYDCKCPVCTSSLKKHNGNAANLWYAFLNRVARACRKEFPAFISLRTPTQT